MTTVDANFPKESSIGMYIPIDLLYANHIVSREIGDSRRASARSKVSPFANVRDRECTRGILFWISSCSQIFILFSLSQAVKTHEIPGSLAIGVHERKDIRGKSGEA